ncbi:MAG: DUF3828 domain-containing protein [Pyrinomonadaceae bacterium]
MKTHRFYLIYFVVTIAVLTGSQQHTLAQFTDSMGAGPQTPDSVIKDFYKWYINTIDSGVEPTVKGRQTLKRYITARQLRQVDREEKLPDADVDAILPTQEWDKTWANTVKVSKLAVKGTTATAIVTFGGASYPRLLVTLVREAGVWKIDHVKDVSQ